MTPDAKNTYIPGGLVVLGLGVIQTAWNSSEDYPIQSAVILLAAVGLVGWAINRLVGGDSN